MFLVLVMWRVAKCGTPYSESVLCIKPIQMQTNPEQCATICCSAWRAVGVLCLTQGRGCWRKRALFIHSPHLQFLPALRLEPATFGHTTASGLHRHFLKIIHCTPRHFWFGWNGEYHLEANLTKMIERIQNNQIVSHAPQGQINLYIVSTVFKIHKTLNTPTPNWSEDLSNFIIFQSKHLNSFKWISSFRSIMSS